MAGPSTTLKFLREEKWPESKGVYLTPGPFWKNKKPKKKTAINLRTSKLMHEKGTMNRLPGLLHTFCLRSHLTLHLTVCLNTSNHQTSETEWHLCIHCCSAQSLKKHAFQPPPVPLAVQSIKEVILFQGFKFLGGKVVHK